MAFGVAGLSVSDFFFPMDVYCEGTLGKRKDCLPGAVGSIKLLVKGALPEVILMTDVEVVVSQILKILLVKSGDLEEVLADDIVKSLSLIPFFDSSGIDLDEMSLSSLVIDNDLGVGETFP